MISYPHDTHSTIAVLHVVWPCHGHASFCGLPHFCTAACKKRSLNSLDTQKHYQLNGCRRLVNFLSITHFQASTKLSGTLFWHLAGLLHGKHDIHLGLCWTGFLLACYSCEYSLSLLKLKMSSHKSTINICTVKKRVTTE